MTQMPIDFGARIAGRGDWGYQLDWARRAVDLAGHKNVAYELDVSPSALTDALIEREGEGRKRRLAGEYLAVILRMSSVPMRHEYLRVKCDALGFEPPIPRRVKTAEEELAELKQLLSERLGDVGKQLISEVQGGKR